MIHCLVLFSEPVAMAAMDNPGETVAPQVRLLFWVGMARRLSGQEGGIFWEEACSRLSNLPTDRGKQTSGRGPLAMWQFGRVAPQHERKLFKSKRLGCVPTLPNGRAISQGTSNWVIWLVNWVNPDVPCCCTAAQRLKGLVKWQGGYLGYFSRVLP